MRGILQSSGDGRDHSERLGHSGDLGVIDRKGYLPLRRPTKRHGSRVTGGENVIRGRGRGRFVGASEDQPSGRGSSECPIRLGEKR